MTSDSHVAITYVGHATVLVEVGGVRILTDPMLRSSFGPARRVCGKPRREDLGRVDAVLISHLHHDHFDRRSLAMVGTDVPLVVPAGAGALAKQAGFARVRELPRGASVEFGGVAVRAVPAVHHGRRLPFGPSAETVGYVLSAGERSVYFAGDTGLFDGMAHLAAHVDVALLPVWGWGPHLRGGHLTPALAAEATRLIHPTFVVPIHWGTYWPWGLGWYRRGRLTAPPAEFRDHVVAQGLPSTVVVLEPGGRRVFEEL